MAHASEWLRSGARRARTRLAAHIRQVVGDVADDVVGPSEPLPRTRLDHLNRRIFRATQVLAGAELQLRAISESLAPPSGPFHPQLTMAAVLRRHPGARDVLAAVGLPGCGGCAVRHDETLAEAIDAYGFDGPLLLARLNALLHAAPEGSPPPPALG